MSQDSAQSLAGLLLISNTPRFLYRGLQRHPFVDGLASNLSEEDLATLAVELGAQSNQLPEDKHLEAYAMIGALSLKHGARSAAALNILSKLPIRWAKDLCDLAGLSTLSESKLVQTQLQPSTQWILDPSSTLFSQQTKRFESKNTPTPSPPRTIVLQ